MISSQRGCCGSAARQSVSRATISTCSPPISFSRASSTKARRLRAMLWASSVAIRIGRPSRGNFSTKSFWENHAVQIVVPPEHQPARIILEKLSDGLTKRRRLAFTASAFKEENPGRARLGRRTFEQGRRLKNDITPGDLVGQRMNANAAGRRRRSGRARRRPGAAAGRPTRPCRSRSSQRAQTRDRQASWAHV